MKEYALQTRAGKTRVLLHKRFKTAEEAKKWGDWNDRGRGDYKVVEVISPQNLTTH